MIKVSLCVCVSNMYISNAKSFHSCPALCNSMDCSLPGSLVHGIFLAKILEWVAFPPPWDPPNMGTEPTSPASPAGRWIVYQWVPWEAPSCYMCCAVLSCSVVSDSLHSKDCSLPGSSFHGDTSGKDTGVGCHALLRLLYTSW